MIIDLPFPHKLLWPNGSRGSPRAVNGEVKKHKSWAHIATCGAGNAARNAVALADAPIPIAIEVCPKPRGPLPDADNCSAAAKAYLDGIALRLEINDRHFAAPTITFGPRTSRFIIKVGP